LVVVFVGLVGIVGLVGVVNRLAGWLAGGLAWLDCFSWQADSHYGWLAGLV